MDSTEGQTRQKIDALTLTLIIVAVVASPRPHEARHVPEVRLVLLPLILLVITVKRGGVRLLEGVQGYMQCDHCHSQEADYKRY